MDGVIKMVNRRKWLSKLVHSSDKDFIVEWSDIRRRGMLRFIFKYTTLMTVLMGIIGVFFAIHKHSMFGFEQSQTMIVAIVYGFIMGLVLSLLNWALNNDRFRNIKDHKS